MKLTREQYDEQVETFYLDSFNISMNEDEKFELFNTLPTEIQSIAISWGGSDTVFRDELFRYLCKKLYNMTIKEYYESDIYKSYINGE